MWRRDVCLVYVWMYDWGGWIENSENDYIISVENTEVLPSKNGTQPVDF